MINNTNSWLLGGDAVKVCVPQIMSKIINLNKHNEKKSLLARDKSTNVQWNWSWDYQDQIQLLFAVWLVMEASGLQVQPMSRVNDRIL